MTPPPERRLALKSPAAQSVHSVPRRKCQHEPEQDSFKYNEQDLILVADTVPPIGHEVVNAVCRRGDVVRQLRPSLIRVDARDGLEQVGGEILSRMSWMVLMSWSIRRLAEWTAACAADSSPKW
jgi:hypothetical protein